jgi:hypothetical protein
MVNSPKKFEIGSQHLTCLTNLNGPNFYVDRVSFDISTRNDEFQNPIKSHALMLQ